MRISAKLTLYAHSLRTDSEILNSLRSRSAEALPVHTSASASSKSLPSWVRAILAEWMSSMSCVFILWTIVLRLFDQIGMADKGISLVLILITSEFSLTKCARRVAWSPIRSKTRAMLACSMAENLSMPSFRSTEGCCKDAATWRSSKRRRASIWRALSSMS